MQIINLLTNRFTGCHSFTFWRENETGKGVAGCHRMSPNGVVNADTQIKGKEEGFGKKLISKSEKRKSEAERRMRKAKEVERCRKEWIAKN